MKQVRPTEMSATEPLVTIPDEVPEVLEVYNKCEYMLPDATLRDIAWHQIRCADCQLALVNKELLRTQKKKLMH